MLVDPRLRDLGKPARVDLPRCDQHLVKRASILVAVVGDVTELVVRADLLELGERLPHRRRRPDRRVLELLGCGRRGARVDGLERRVRRADHAAQVVGVSRHRDGALDVGSFQRRLVGRATYVWTSIGHTLPRSTLSGRQHQERDRATDFHLRVLAVAKRMIAVTIETAIEDPVRGQLRVHVSV